MLLDISMVTQRQYILLFWAVRQPRMPFPGKKLCTTWGRRAVWKVWVQPASLGADSGQGSGGHRVSFLGGTGPGQGCHHGVFLPALR